MADPEIPEPTPEIPEGYVSPEELKDKYVSRSVHNALVEDAVKKRLSGHVNRSKAPDDPDIIKEVLSRHGKKGEVDLDAHFKTWDQKHAEPLRQELDKWKRKSMRGEILRAAADLNVEERFLQSTGPDDPSYVEILLQGRLEYDDRYGFIAVEGGERVPSGDSDRPFANVADVLKRWQSNPAEYGWLFKDSKITTGGKPGYSGPSGAPTLPSRSKMSRKEKADYIEKYGQEAFFNLPQ